MAGGTGSPSASPVSWWARHGRAAVVMLIIAVLGLWLLHDVVPVDDRFAPGWLRDVFFGAVVFAVGVVVRQRMADRRALLQRVARLEYEVADLRKNRP
jgi:hypothetical protein